MPTDLPGPSTASGLYTNDFNYRWNGINDTTLETPSFPLSPIGTVPGATKLASAVNSPATATGTPIGQQIVGAVTQLTAPATSSVADSWYVRTIVVVIGLIFVAAGLVMFKGGSPVDVARRTVGAH